MGEIVVTMKANSDGSVHLPPGTVNVDAEVRVIVEPISEPEKKRPMLASDLLNSGLVGMWADRTDITDNHEFARRLREEAQDRRREP